MARKKIEPIVSLGADTDKLTVQKSKPLFALWRSDLTLAEFKILDTYLSRIDSKKPERREVVFEKGELESLLGVQRIRTDELDKRLEHLMTSIKITDDTSKKKKAFARIALFEKAYVEQDENGLWQATLTCTSSAMKYIFNIEHLGYLRYKLRCITNITSRYTYILFLYIEQNRFRKSWEVDLQELKEMLSCENVETYNQFKEFNKQVLKRSQTEMHEKTECRYEYTPIKTGRRVTKIRFTVETLPKIVESAEDPDQTTIDQYIDMGKELWYDAIKDTIRLSDAQYDELRSLLVVVPDDVLPKVVGGRDFMLYHYIDLKAREIKRRNEEKPIRNKYNYLVKMIKQDMKEGDE